VTRRTIVMEMNRVEGDLQVKLALDGHTVTDAWCTGTMFRGFEQILVGREAGDALVITPRICGICSTSQLYAATTALETAYGAPIAPNGTRVRNVCLMGEAVMNDARHTFLMFAPDLCNRAYASQPLYERILAAFEPPFAGRVARETVQHSKQILGVIIAFGGQWPHATYMMPGGVTAPLDDAMLRHCREAIDAFAAWWERAVLGCALERWLAISSVAELDAWLDEAPAHREGAAGLLLAFGRAIGLDRTGRGSPRLLSAGCYFDPERWQPPFSDGPGDRLFPGGYYDGVSLEPFDHRHVAEHVRHSWFEPYEGGRHPWEGETRARYVDDGERYSFAKAPRYRDEVVQLGPIADLYVAGDRLVRSLVHELGTSTLARQLARVHRPALLLVELRRQIDELARRLHEPTLVPVERRPDGDGHALVNAARGTLGHWVKLRGGRIAGYQVITPTSWNGSPRDSAGRRGHWEESFIGLEIADLDDPVELAHVVRSHDACLVCTVHFVGDGAPRAFRA
jgi:Ni,Fe-hydrogenase I large subunit